MKLNPEIAKGIVQSLKDFINHEINLFDTAGRVIASTDKSRIGTIHEAARLAAARHEKVVVSDDDQYHGARCGVNVPILFNDAVLAVVGITGEPSIVEPYGTIVGRMTELLIRENHERIVRFDQREQYANLINVLVLKRHDHNLVDYLASTLNISFSVRRRAVVGVLDAPDEYSVDEIYPLVYDYFSREGNSFFSTSSGEVRLFTDLDDGRLGRLAKTVAGKVEASLGTPMRFGIGDEAGSERDYWKSYDQAVRAFRWARFVGTERLCRFCDMGEGIVLTGTDPAEAREYIQHVLGNIPDKDLEWSERIFDAYMRHNGSIKHCSEELYIHKNTLQSRLNKIARDTGYNPRVLSDFVVLRAAFALRGYLASAEKA